MCKRGSWSVSAFWVYRVWERNHPGPEMEWRRFLKYFTGICGYFGKRKKQNREQMELKAPLFIQRRITGLTSKSSDTEIHHKTDLFIKNSIVVENSKEISTKNISAITESYKFLDKFLQSKNYLAGPSLTVADLCCVATVSTATIITPISTEKYPNLSTWYRTCKNLPFYEETNGAGLNKLDALVELKLGRPRTKDFCE
ncbi:hypothetical protein GEV33_000667 [Tenebrio molitor]|uniref:GST C-terminal domain-containing protein n=1 Tax=Tenebrio molitor TaxID=7067 RepID=A0A8J6HWQ7_TENMO|nr:hypothetical protein GEV33_000667 [Tenebrio molitor]